VYLWLYAGLCAVCRRLPRESGAAVAGEDHGDREDRQDQQEPPSRAQEDHREPAIHRTSEADRAASGVQGEAAVFVFQLAAKKLPALLLKARTSPQEFQIQLALLIHSEFSLQNQSQPGQKAAGTQGKGR